MDEEKLRQLVLAAALRRAGATHMVRAYINEPLDGSAGSLRRNEEMAQRHHEADLAYECASGDLLNYLMDYFDIHVED